MMIAKVGGDYLQHLLPLLLSVTVGWRLMV